MSKLESSDRLRFAHEKNKWPPSATLVDTCGMLLLIDMVFIIIGI
jgi:hypothetical protein